MHVPLAQVLADADQLVIALQPATLKRLATGTAECIADGMPIVAIVVLQHESRALPIGCARFGKEQVGQA